MKLKVQEKNKESHEIKNKHFMKYEDYKEFVINYKPFEWEISPSDFREYIKGKHNFIIGFIRELSMIALVLGATSEL